MPFEIQHDKFSGPLQLLLELIEQEKLPITDVSLARVTEDFLRHVDDNDVQTDELADFLVVATRLLLIKSRAILPDAMPAEAEEEAGDLAGQLRMYKRFVEASTVVESRFDAGAILFARDRVPVVRETGFSPPPSATPAALAESMRALLKRLAPFFALKQTTLERVASVQERMEQLRGAVLERARMAFHEIVGPASSRVDVVVSFLALLELMKQRVVRASQGDTFHEIVIVKGD